MTSVAASQLARLVPAGRSSRTASAPRRCTVPDMSITIRPSGDAYRLAREVIDALGHQCPANSLGEPSCAEDPCTVFEPHVTLQYVYDVPPAEVDLVADALEQLFRDRRAVPITFGAVGTFPGFPGVHVDVE